MLVRFAVKNFLSFKDLQEFSFIKGKVQNNAERVLDADKLKLLKFGAIFGANASGKSNLVKSMYFAKQAILDVPPSSRRWGAYKLEETCLNEPSYFEFELYIGGKCYSYGFEFIVKSHEYISEWLIELGTNKSEKIIFERDIRNGNFVHQINIKDEAIKTKYGVYSEDTRRDSNVLFLQEMNRSKGDLYREKSEISIIRDIFLWFKDNLRIEVENQSIGTPSYFVDPDKKEEICRLISSLDTGVTSYEIKTLSRDETEEDFPAKLLSDFERTLRKAEAPADVALLVKGPRKMSLYFISLNSDQELELSTLVFKHGSSSSIFEFDEESDGTRRIIELIDVLLGEENKLYVIDELDRSLHPQLTYQFVKEYLKLAEKRNIQLLITTHESRLLDFNLLRRDEIWFVDKGEDGASDLYSLDDFNVRFDKKIDKAYLEGRYGGVPIFSTIFPLEES